MILPIVAFGHQVLRKDTVEIDADYNGLNELIENMFETMYASSGVGLAAPQINKSIRLFVIDAKPFDDDLENGEIGGKRVFINPNIIEESGEEWTFNEGCLSVPDIREDVLRKPNILIEYYDAKFEYHKDIFSGVLARIIQHEYDHIEGKVFVDRINPLRKMMLKKKLNNISKGDIDIGYKMIFAKK